ncbi:sialate O-acetylesterase [Mucilaginibacter calamicampi]|uniref:Sialate O-acetylesterase n=1 Tax=Mucilaginibacter calamicampi TaxID=1302352 RepID=A0ABW2Z034_9SPHI
MKKIKYLLPLLAVLLCATNSFALVRVPPIIGSNMVLQQNAKATLWGWGDASERFTVISSWKTTPDEVTSSPAGKWKIQIATPPAGGPYTITLKGRSNTIVLENILIGEVWLCSGQSNMEVSNNKQIRDELPTAANDKIRFFQVAHASSEYPQEFADGKWVACNEESLKRFSAVAYFFGKKINKELNVPIGLIQSAWSGTPIELWEPQSIIDSDADMIKASKTIKTVTYRPDKPGLIYNSMIAPIISYTIAGTLWYQGEGNVPRAYAYEKMLTGMIADWRTKNGNEFPFYIVQIAPFSGYELPIDAALLYEQQTRTLKYPKTGMVVITDLVDDIKSQHPIDKLTVGNRLANLALADTYKKPIPLPEYRNPMFNRMEISKGKATLYLDYAPNGFMLKGDAKKATEFTIAGEDHNFVPADEVKLDKGKIVVSSKAVPNPVAVRFSFTNIAMSNLFNKEGLPVNPFRTDDWK